MISSLTIGSLAATVLAMTAEASPRGILGETTRGAYAALKTRIAQWASRDVAILERMYASWTRKDHIAKIIEQQPPADQASIKDLTSALLEGLKQDVLRGSVGISIRRLEVMHQQLMAVGVA